MIKKKIHLKKLFFFIVSLNIHLLYKRLTHTQNPPPPTSWISITENCHPGFDIKKFGHLSTERRKILLQKYKKTQLALYKEYKSYV